MDESHHKNVRLYPVTFIISQTHNDDVFSGKSHTYLAWKQSDKETRESAYMSLRLYNDGLKERLTIEYHKLTSASDQGYWEKANTLLWRTAEQVLTELQDEGNTGALLTELSYESRSVPPHFSGSVG